MYEQKKRELTEYLKPRDNLMLIVMGIFMIVFSFMAILAEIPVLLLLFFLGVGVMMLVIGLRSMLDYPRYITALEQSGKLRLILQDFSQAHSMVNDGIRFGHKLLYSKGAGRVMSYSEIVRVYQYIHRTNFVEDRRELRCTTRDGKTLTLCRLKTRGKSDGDVRLAVMMIHQKNPSIQIGYK